ncbi:uncharacterized protein LOC118317753 isoform X2 [Scophthalmus maximus]|uniref:uncharacterized protein LOC118317753 isoform X2 n=1 Tax=Scophthalmus maximus TaxID=52904 RepID=UPI001FA91DDD|nr:uncharacterized protein LOC118317753 isoform X2 [Scophthalmus maximus]
MEKQKKTVRIGNHTPDTQPIIVVEVKKPIPRMRVVKPKERIKVTTLNKGTTTCETSGNIMKLCVNLMPVLASAKEPAEDEEEKDEDISCTGLTLDRATERTRSLNPLFVLPAITQPAAAPECCDHHRHHRTRSFSSSLPPITSSEKTTTTSSPNFTTKDCGGDAAVTGQVSLDSRPWIDNVLFSKSRSAEFRLPDISLSSLDALLQTVTQKLARKRRGGGQERPWARVQSDHLLMAAWEQRLGEKRVDPANIEAATEISVAGLGVNRQRSLRPKPTLILTMTKKNLLTNTVMQ